MLTTKNWDGRCVCLFIAFLAWGAGSGCTPPAARSLLEGDRLIQEGKYTRAMDRLKVATTSAPLPARAKAWNLLGVAHHGARQFPEAIQAYQRAQQLDSSLAATRFNLGCLFLEQNNWERAATELGAYLVLHQDYAPAWTKLGNANLRGKRLDLAEQNYRTALQLDPTSAEALNGLGIIQLYRKRLEPSVELFRAALKHQTNYAPAKLNLAVLNQHYLNDHTTALQLYRDYLRVSGPSPQMGPVQTVVQQLERELVARPAVAATPADLPSIGPARTNPPTLPPPSSTSRVATANPSSNAPVPSSTPITQPKPAAAPAQVAAAGITPADSVASPRLDNKPQPVAGTDAAETTIPPKTRSQVATGSAESHDPLPVVTVSDNSLSSEEPKVRPAPDRPDASTADGSNNNSESSDPIGAGMVVNRAREKPGVTQRLNPKNWFRGKERDDSAASKPGGTDLTLDSAQNVTPPANPAPVPAEFPANLERPRTAQAQSSRPAFPRYAYRSAARLSPGNRPAAEAYFSKALRAHRERRLAQAMEDYERAVQLDPSYFDAHYNLGLAAFDLRDMRQSLQSYENALALNPESVDARFNFALALQRGNYPIDAVAELKKLTEGGRDESRVHFALGKLFADQLNDVESARLHYRRVLELEPKHPFALSIRYWLAEH